MDYEIILTVEEMNLLNRCLVEPAMKPVLENYTQEYEHILQLLSHLSIQKNDMDALQFLVETKGADVVHDLLPVIYACQFGEIEIFKYLVSRGANVITQPQGLMILACLSGSLDIVKIIVDICEQFLSSANEPNKLNEETEENVNEENEENVNEETEENVNEENEENVNEENELNEENEENVNEENELNEENDSTILNQANFLETKNTLLIFCAMTHYLTAVKFLLEYGADPYTSDSLIIKTACINNDIDLLKLYLELGLRIDFNGHLNLSYASSNGNFEIMKLLLEHGVDPKVFHLSAFVASIESNNIESLKFLFTYLDERRINVTESEVQFLIKKCEPCSAIAMYLLTRYNIAFDSQFPFDIQVSKECPVCLGSASLILPCRHAICSTCLVSLPDKLCPFCRLQIDSNLIKRIVCIH
jgi:ankyrin repeat protein